MPSPSYLPSRERGSNIAVPVSSASSLRRSVTLNAIAAYIPQDPLSRISWKSKDKKTLTDNEREVRSREITTSTADVPPRALSTIAPNTMHASSTSSSPSREHNTPKSNTATIRSVAAEPATLESPSNGVGKRTISRSENSAMPHAMRPPPLTSSHSGPPLSWQNSNSIGVSKGLVRTISTEYGLNTKYNGNGLHVSDGPIGLSSSTTSPTLSSGNSTPEFNAAIGRANVGKSGRVIEKLSGERDMLRRDLKLAQLNTDECRKATRMAEERMDAQASEYEARLHEASINKSLLERKLRQVEELKTQIDGEREKAQRARQMGEYWKKQHDDNEDSCREKVQMAEEKAKHKERMVATMTNHWKDRGAEVDRTVSRLGKEIKCLVDDRRNDDVQIQRLNNLCEQQSEQLKKLAGEKAAIQQQFEDYKKLQEESLAKIKADATAMETHCTEVTKMATDTLGELRWTLAVKRDLRSEPPEQT